MRDPIVRKGLTCQIPIDLASLSLNNLLEVSIFPQNFMTILPFHARCPASPDKELPGGTLPHHGTSASTLAASTNLQARPSPAVMFGVVFPDHTFPLDATAFAQVAPNSWLLDLSTLALAAAPRSAVVFLLPAAARQGRRRLLPGRRQSPLRVPGGARRSASLGQLLAPGGRRRAGACCRPR